TAGRDSSPRVPSSSRTASRTNRCDGRPADATARRFDPRAGGCRRHRDSMDPMTNAGNDGGAAGERRDRYVEDFDDGAGGWVGWRRQGVNVPLDVKDGVARIQGPFGVDTYHAPHYLSLVAYLHTREGLGLDLGRPNRFLDGGFS